MVRTETRREFLTGVLTTAIENYGYGWFVVHEYKPGDENPYAVIESEDENETFRVDLDTIAKGLGVIRRAVLKATPVEEKTFQNPGSDYVHHYTTGGETVLHNATTGERLYMSEGQRRNIMLADRTNHEDGDLDVIDALAIVECALFGRVVFG